jgi:hypothetical protein
VIGKNEFSPELENILVQMKKGETWTIEGISFAILDSSQVKYSIEVVELGNIVDVRTPFQKA